MSDDISFLQEIDDALRADRLEQFWKKHGKTLLIAALAIVLFAGASAWWKHHLQGLRAEQTTLLLRADTAQKESKSEEAITLLTQAAGGREQGVAALASLKLAHLYRDRKETDKALVLYRKVAAMKGIDESVTDAAALEANMLSAKDAPLDTGIYAPLQSEVTAARLMKEGKTKEAREIWEMLAKNMTIPATIRTRAQEVLVSLPKEAK